ncbi:MAG: Bax inhibitor-1 family protein [Planctomycetota bacterium]|jgi:hypothetical protein|nr:Bax inhibitor-1 family protein [Planctomycetota bacterium]
MSRQEAEGFMGLQDIVAAQASTDARAEFIAKTYFHLTGAIFAFAFLVAGLMQTEFGPRLAAKMVHNWILVLGLFMVAGYVANHWAANATSMGKQYVGLTLYIVIEAIIFLPLLLVAQAVAPDAIPSAALLTLVTFAGLTGIVFKSRRNFSFMGPMLGVASLVALGTIVCSILFGFSLGIGFSALMVLMAAGYVLYETSRVMNEYPVGSHVAASLALFAAIALMFWYILRILISMRD